MNERARTEKAQALAAIARGQREDLADEMRDLATQHMERLRHLPADLLEYLRGVLAGSTPYAGDDPLLLLTEAGRQLLATRERVGSTKRLYVPEEREENADPDRPPIIDLPRGPRGAGPDRP